MRVIEEAIPLLPVPAGFTPVIPISSDYVFGTHIQIDFDKQYGLSDVIKSRGRGIYPDCLFVNGVFCLVIKQKFSHRPEYENIEAALSLLCEELSSRGIENIIMPRIGCVGNDNLRWKQVAKYVLAELKPLAGLVKVSTIEN